MEYKFISSSSNQPILIGQTGITTNTTTPQKFATSTPANSSSVGGSQGQFQASYRKNLEEQHIPIGNLGRGGDMYFSENTNNILPLRNYGSTGLNSISPNLMLKKYERDQDDLARLSLEEINRELDTNMNEIIVLLNKRKHLIIVKRQKLKDEFREQTDSLKRATVEELMQDIDRGSTEENTMLQNIASSADSFSKMKKVVHSVTKDLSLNLQDKQRQEATRSAEFWGTNKNFEDEVDLLLQKLKFFDSELEKTNYQIQEVCRNLDSMEEQIKILLLAKDEDHIRRAEPVFIQKQRLHEQLNLQNAQRNKIKDEKIGIITRIIDYLSDLKQIREDRLRDLSEIFGIDDQQADCSTKIQYYVDFAGQLENLAKIKDNLSQTEMQEDQIQAAIDRLFKENDQLFGELIKKQSEEAKVYADLADNYAVRANSQRAIELFMTAANLQNLETLDIRQLLQRFRDNIIFLKPLVEEDSALKQGLSKTFETINTFSNMLLAIETEKERRKELVVRLEQCIRLKGEGDMKTEELRNTEMDETKKGQQKKNMEEDLDHILSEADLEEYKRIGNQMKQIERESEELGKKRNRLQTEVDQISQQVVQRINQIRIDYDDIMREVISNDTMNKFDFRNANDIKQVKNLLKKTFKRLGVSFDESKMM